MSQLVPPHNSEQVKPLLLPETERVEERKRAENSGKFLSTHARSPTS